MSTDRKPTPVGRGEAAPGTKRVGVRGDVSVDSNGRLRGSGELPGKST